MSTRVLLFWEKSHYFATTNGNADTSKTYIHCVSRPGNPSIITIPYATSAPATDPVSSARSSPVPLATVPGTGKSGSEWYPGVILFRGTEDPGAKGVGILPTSHLIHTLVVKKKKKIYVTVKKERDSSAVTPRHHSRHS